jgi:membrane-bound lytic murein transglycosylase D
LQQFLSELQRRLAGASIYDLASLHETAQRLLPVLLQFEETKPYGAWLEAHLDYLEVSNQLLRESIPTPPPPTPVVPRPPSPDQNRKAWNRQLSKRAVPARAPQLVPRLKQIFASEQMPGELVWLAEVESSFNPQARSPAGAVGLFQLMPVTARSLNLATQPQDERLNPDKNARAAARYLRQLHGRFGNWPLALAAYNAGPTRVEALLKKQGGSRFDDIASRLPAETQMFVPKVMATVSRREGVGVETLKLPKG